MTCHCTRCHGLMECVALRGDNLPIGWICVHCEFVWQLDIGWNPYLNRFDADMLTPRYA